MSADPMPRKGLLLPGRAAYSINEARQQLGNISQATIYHFINSGQLRSFKLGRRRLVSSDALRDFIRNSEFESNPELATTFREGLAISCHSNDDLPAQSEASEPGVGVVGRRIDNP